MQEPGSPGRTHSETDASAPRAADAITIEIDYDPRVNYAMQQNSVPVVQLLRVTNTTAATRENLVARVTIDSEFADPLELRIDRLAAGESVTFETPDLALDPTILARQTERESTRMRVVVEEAGEAVAATTCPLEILAYNEWSGLASLPETLAAFVMPNHPDIQTLLGEAAASSEQRATRRGFPGYQNTSPADVREAVASIYAAVRAQRITYGTTAASYETTGQKIRSPELIAQYSFANCLDLVVLFAALFEQAGLHPVPVLVRGHALLAVWLHDESFPEASFDDVTRLRKRIDLGEMLALEATAVTSGTSSSFERACELGRRHLDDEDAFLCGIDIRRARAMSIRPLPYRMGDGRFVTPPGDEAPPSDEAHPATTPRESFADAPRATAPEAAHPSPIDPDRFKPDEPEVEPEQPAASEETTDRDEPGTRLDRWKQRLLDLTLRNRLLNFRPTRKTLELSFTDPAALEDALADGTEFALFPKPTFLEDQGRSATLHSDREQSDSIDDFVRAEFADRRLRTPYDGEELDHRLREVYRAARNDLEESGTNSLYLALGFLSWRDANDREKERLAPLVLVPVQIVRRSISEGYRVRTLDEEPRINVTLLEKLRTELGIDTAGLDELPEDDSGVDVARIFRRFRVAVKGVPHFDIREKAAIGTFSFTKFLMWSDLETRADHLLESEVVRHLVETPDRPLHPKTEFVAADRLDADYAPERILCPLDADSSQLAAVLAGADGKSFVLQGPPGTGKSQTITNLIAHALGRGMRVLFVAEKRAALEVVHRRLTSIGLVPYCLELHSNKTSKRHVLDQLAEALETRAEPPGDFESHAKALATSRSELNDYVAELHAPRAIGASIHEALARLTTLRDVDRVPVELESIDAIDAETFAHAREIADRLRIAANAVGDLTAHPLSGIGRTRFETSLPDRAKDDLATLARAAEQLEDATGRIADLVGLPVDAKPSEAQHALLDRVTSLLLETPGATHDLLDTVEWAERRARLTEWIDRAVARDALRAALCDRYTPSLLQADLDGLIARLRAAKDKFAPLRWLAHRGVRSSVRPFLLEGSMPKPDALLTDLETARRLRDETAALGDPECDPARAFGTAWDRGNGDADTLRRRLEWAEAWRAAMLEVDDSFDTPTAHALREAGAALAVDRRDTIAEGTPRARRLVEHGTAVSDFLRARAALESRLEIDADTTFGGADRSDHLGTVRETCRIVTEALGSLRDWCHWQLVRGEARDAGIGAILERFDAGQFAADRFVRVLDRSILEAWVRVAIDSIEALRTFHSAEHERKIEKFRALDRRWLDITRDELRARLAKAVPTLDDDAAATSEAGILLRQLKLKRRHLPVRRLLERLPNLMPRLKPCFLMSPLSIAQYLDPDYPRFDLVIFDEASQIPVQDAIGALARGKQAVIVGDSKQLPPTDFFQKADRDDDEWIDEDDVVELESILDECEAGGLPRLHLAWHYRSRHESLIAFSNARYYDRRLFTFPGPEAVSDELGVSLRFVENGVYDRGGTRTNRAEAEAIVAEVVARLEAAVADGVEPPALGVVAFSRAQQTLIEDLLEEARRDRPSIDRFFGDEREEPLFIKNLENVQGDERDVILFSICYGPDAHGKMSMTFGPLNREGGERRLNVAITRARARVLVFSSIRSDAIDLSKTRSTGVRHLAEFLAYAERGGASPGGHDRDPAYATPELADDVAARLTRTGFQADPAVGTSSYRVDVGVREHEDPDRYRLGVECDGPTYAGASTARDRDRIRHEVLGRLGWQLERVWSTDWWSDAEREVRRLTDAVAVARRAGTSENESPAVEHRDASSPADDERPANASSSAPEKAPVSAEDLSSTHESEANEADARRDEQDPPPERFARAAAHPTQDAPPIPENPVAGRPYPETADATIVGDSDAFYDSGSKTKITATLREHVDREAPIHIDRLTRIVAERFGIERVTQRVQTHVLEALASMDPTPTLADDFVWHSEQGPDDYRGFRTPGPGSEPVRGAEEIPPIEIANAAEWILSRQISLPQEDLERELARTFGFARMGSRVRAAMTDGIVRLEGRGGCRRQGHRITIADR